MSDKPINIVLSVSHRFDCLNIFLDILKNNFKKRYVTHVFCNLEEKTFEKNCNLIDFDLIDCLYKVPDPDCGLRQKSKLENRRRQPLDFFVKILELIYKDTNVDEFIYSECDQFPLNEKKYILPLSALQENEVKGRYIDIKNPKMPSGYLSPCPLYIEKKACPALIENFKMNRSAYLSQSIAFEGMVANSIAHNQFIKFHSISNHFISNYDYDKNFEPISATTHQHNIFNLRGEFCKRKINNGKWVKQVLEKTSIKQWWDKSVISYDKNFPKQIKDMPVN